MRIMNAYLDDFYLAWAKFSMNCCASPEPPSASLGLEKPMRTEYAQPLLIPPPVLEPQERPSSRGREWVTRTKSFASRASSRGRFSVRRTLNAYNGPRRPRISAPSEFRHIETSAPRQLERFGPLELSIYLPTNQLSPLLPHFGTINDLPCRNSVDVSIPPAVHLSTGRSSNSQLRRKPVRLSSGTTYGAKADSAYFSNTLYHEEGPVASTCDTPQVPPRARVRSLTEPSSYERVKSAVHEKFELEQRLRDIKETIEERTSLYLKSRPSSQIAYHPDNDIPDGQETMPSLQPSPSPLAALRCQTIQSSFATRISPSSFAQRPRTAPSNPVHIPTRLKSFSEASATFSTPSSSSAASSRALPHDWDTMPPPPLPLVLQAPRPPLRKKKSFSRVSSWLFTSQDTSNHTRSNSLESVTNKPKPLTSREGFYQCVASGPSPAASTVSLSTFDTLAESELDGPTAPTNWTRTPDSSPGGNESRGHGSSLALVDTEKSLGVTRVRAAGAIERLAKGDWHVEIMPVYEHVDGTNSVGIAF